MRIIMTEDTQPKVKIRVRNITKQFELLTTRSQKIRNLLSFRRKGKTDFWALRGVSFDVYDGEAVAVIGLNGSGKSTLSNIVSEIYPPTTGTLEIHGDSSIIAIGSGLKNQLTGRDNIRLKLLMNGLKNREINALMPAIIDFSELGAFIEQPVKSYSSGMKSKLGFAIMAHTNPDVMLIDEALSVGDATFANKSFAKIKEFKAQGKTIFFVSHSMSQLRKIADRVIWMHFGEVRMMGPVDEVLPKYEKWLASFNQLTDEQREFYNLQMKEEQRRFSLESYMAAKAEAKLQSLPVAGSRLEKIEQEKQKIQVGKQLQKQLTTNKQKLKQKRFGYINWLVAGVLILAVIFTSLTVFSSEMAKYQQEQEAQKSVKKAQFKAYKSSSKVSKSSSSEVVDTDGDGIPDDQDTTPNGEADTSVIDTDGDGIPDDQDTTPNGEADTSVIDTDGDGIPDDQDTTPNGEANSSQDTTSNTDVVVGTN
jgi:teichoic acid transport system ATP-binding protein